MQAGLHRGLGFDSPMPGNRQWQIVLPSLVAFVFDVALRMQVELQPQKHDRFTYPGRNAASSSLALLNFEWVTGHEG
jgi:hypothetical protein